MKLVRVLLFGLSLIYFLLAAGFYAWWFLAGDWLFGYYSGPPALRIAAIVFGIAGVLAFLLAVVGIFRNT